MKETRGPWIFRKPWLAGFVALAFLVSGCSTDNPVEDPSPCDHFDADGLELEQDGNMINRQFNGLNTGTVEVDAGATLADIFVTFLTESRVNGELVPEILEFEEGCGDDFSLTVTFEDPTIARATGINNDDYHFDLEGLQEGQTTFQVALTHGDHDDFVSLEIPLTVGPDSLPPAIEPEAVFVRDGPNPIATWNHDEVRGPGVATGPMLVRLGQTRANLETVFEGAWDSGDGGVESGSREIVPVPEGPYTLHATMDDEAIAQIQLGSEVTRFDLIGTGVGQTTVVLELRYRGTAILTSGPIPVVCVDPTNPEVSAPSFTCVASGLKSVIIDSGVNLPALLPGEGAPCSWWTPGEFEVDEGRETTLYSVREFRVNADPCDTNTISRFTHRLSFEFADPEIVRVTNHPFHWNEVTIFHLNGLQAGTTTMTLYVTDVGTGALRWVSPPMPVRVTAP